MSGRVGGYESGKMEESKSSSTGLAVDINNLMVPYEVVDPDVAEHGEAF